MTKFLQSRSLPLLLSRTTLLGLLLLPACAASEVTNSNAGTDGAVVAEGALSPSPLGHYLAGLHAQAQHDLDAAADFMSFALADDPDSLDLLRNTYLLMASEGRMAEAVRLARALEAQDATASTADLTLVLSALEAGDLKAADDQLARLPADGIGKFIAPLLRAWLAFERDGVDQAVAALAPLGEIEGFAPLYNLHVGLLNELGDRPDAAVTHYRTAIEKAQRPSFRLVEILGNFYQRHGRLDEARALYRNYEAENPGRVDLDPLIQALDAGTQAPPIIATMQDGVAEALFDLASVLYQESAGDLALIYTRMALDMRPEFPVARVLLGDILMGQDRVAEAVATYRRIPADSPLNWQARLNIADGLDALGKTDEAVRMLQAMTEEEPDRADAPLRLANLLRSHERFAEAAKAYDMTVSRMGDVTPENWSILYFRGIARERSGQWALAEKDFLKALELEPEHPYVMNYLAYSWIEKGENYDRALDMLRRAVDLRPTDGYIVDSLGWVLYRLGNYKEAVEHLERAVELNPTDPVINDHLGDAYWKVGRRQEARFQWRRALNFKPEADQVPEIEAKIERGLSSTHASGS